MAVIKAMARVMVAAARDGAHSLRGFVHYPMRVGEPERSERRDDDDGSASDATKYDETRMPTTATTAATTT